MLLKDIYNANPLSINSKTPIKDALIKMIADNLNGYLVTDDNGKLKGVLSLQDIAAATVPKQFQQNVNMAVAMYREGMFEEACKAIQDKPVSSVMRKKFTIASLDTNVMAVAADFLQNDLYIVPVVDDGKLIGVVTRSQIKRALLENMKV
jgi:CBS domain-containing protein